MKAIPECKFVRTEDLQEAIDGKFAPESDSVLDEWPEFAVDYPVELLARDGTYRNFESCGV